jgi:hypothetical protein
VRIRLILLCLMLFMMVVIFNRKAVAVEPTCLNVVNAVTGNQWFSYTNQDKSVGDTFTINITITNVVGMTGWQMALQWNADLLDFVAVWNPNEEWWYDPMPPPPQSPGLLIWGWNNGPSQSPFNGSIVAAQIVLKIIAPIGESDLSLQSIGTDTFILAGLNQIPFTPIIGYYDYNFHGDVNNDGVVNMKDINIAVQAFNSFPTTPRWNPRADLDGDGRVNMRDINMAVINFNKHL